MPKKQIKLRHPGGAANLIPANQIFTIGRNLDCNIKILEKHVSGHHATLEHREDGTAYIWDNKSKNGTYIKRGEEIIEINEKTQLFPKDVIYLSTKYSLTYENKENTEAKKNLECKKRQRDTEYDLEKEIQENINPQTR